MRPVVRRKVGPPATAAPVGKVHSFGKIRNALGMISSVSDQERRDDPVGVMLGQEEIFHF
jgi:hypothetical protein